jgi:transcriptional regulator with XRE-family HTH domain
MNARANMLTGVMIARIGPKQPLRHYLREWRELRGLTQPQLAERLDTSKDQISRWESNKRGMTAAVMQALAEALQIEPGDLFRDPAQPSADELLREATPEQRRLAFELVEAVLRPTGTGR